MHLHYCMICMQKITPSWYRLLFKNASAFAVRLTSYAFLLFFAPFFFFKVPLSINFNNEQDSKQLILDRIYIYGFGGVIDRYLNPLIFGKLEVIILIPDAFNYFL